MYYSENNPELVKSQLRTEVRRYVQDYVAEEIRKAHEDEYEYDDDNGQEVPSALLKNSSGVFVTPTTGDTFGITKTYPDNSTLVSVRGIIVDENEDVDGWEIRYWEIV